jgi:hypothetical protein
MTTTPLEATLGQLIALEHAVPQSVLDAAKASWTWRTIDLELVELSFDSQLIDASGLRSAVLDSRMLRFSLDGRELDVEIETRGAHVDFAGQITPAPSQLEIQTPTQDISVELRNGRFAVSLELVGPVRFVVRGAGWRHATAWTSL